MMDGNVDNRASLVYLHGVVSLLVVGVQVDRDLDILLMRNPVRTSGCSDPEGIMHSFHSFSPEYVLIQNNF